MMRFAGTICMVIVGIGIALLVWYERHPEPPPADLGSGLATPADPHGASQAQGRSTLPAAAGGGAASAPTPITLTRPSDVIETTTLDRQGGLPVYRMRFDRQRVESAAPGARFELYLPQLDSTVTIVLEGDRDNRYARTVFGHLAGSSGRRRAYFTFGEASLHGTIETDRGIFHIEQQGAEPAIVYDARHIDEPGPDDAIVRDDVPTEPR